MKMQVSLFISGFMIVTAVTSIAEAASMKSQPKLRLDNFHAQSYHQREQDYIGYRRREELLRRQREENDRVRRIASELTSKRDYIGLGNLYYSNGYMQDAIAAYSKAIEVNPRDSDAYFWRARAKGDQNDYRGAIADYDVRIAINPKSDGAYMNRAVNKYKLGDKSGSLQDFRSAARIRREGGATEALKDTLDRIQYFFKVPE